VSRKLSLIQHHGVDELHVPEVPDPFCQITVQLALIQSLQDELPGFDRVSHISGLAQLSINLFLISRSPVQKLGIAQQSIENSI
jgi:pantothenate synthetase